MFPNNVFPETSEIDSHGQLVIGGCNTLDLAEEFGTPVYVIDEITLRNRCREFVKQFSWEVQLFPMVVKTLWNQLD